MRRSLCVHHRHFLRSSEMPHSHMRYIYILNQQMTLARRQNGENTIRNRTITRHNLTSTYTHTQAQKVNYVSYEMMIWLLSSFCS